MSYTSPPNTDVDFEFQSGYSSPTNTSVNFTFNKTSTEAKVFSTAAISQTTSAFGDLQENTTATQGVKTNDVCQILDRSNPVRFTVDLVDSITSTTEKRRVTVAAAAAARTVPSKFEVLEITDNTRSEETPTKVTIEDRLTNIEYPDEEEIKYVDTKNP